MKLFIRRGVLVAAGVLFGLVLPRPEWLNARHRAQTVLEAQSVVVARAEEQVITHPHDWTREDLLAHALLILKADKLAIPDVDDAGAGLDREVARVLKLMQRDAKTDTQSRLTREMIEQGESE